MIIFWGFQDFLVYLVNYLFKCFHYPHYPSFTLMIDVKFNFQCILYLIPPVIKNKVLCTGLQPRNYFGKNIWQSSTSKNKYSIVRIKSDFSSFLNKIYFTRKIYFGYLTATGPDRRSITNLIVMVKITMFT